MGTTSVMGHEVSVKPQEVDGIQLYHVSGSGATTLHKDCVDNQIAVDALTGDTFTVSRSIIDREISEGNSLNREYIASSIKKAARMASIDPLATFSQRLEQGTTRIEPHNR